MDIVYILKEEENNTDLRYSLRSVAKYCSGFNNIWFSGYKPSWVKNAAGYIKTSQCGTKWQNALQNVVNACNTDEISEDFILFNDDFFALKPVNLSTELNFCRGTIEEAVMHWICTAQSPWKRAFWQTKELLTKLNCEHLMDFTLHIPMIINKSNFLQMCGLTEVREHIKKYKMLSFRSVYGNLFWTNPTVIPDCKPVRDYDASEKTIKGTWLSVLDGVTDTLYKYPRIKKALAQFSDKCVYEE